MKSSKKNTAETNRQMRQIQQIQMRHLESYPDIFYKNSYYLINNHHKRGSRSWYAFEVWRQAVERKLVPNNIYEAPTAEFDIPQRGVGPKGSYRTHGKTVYEKQAVKLCFDYD